MLHRNEIVNSTEQLHAHLAERDQEEMTPKPKKIQLTDTKRKLAEGQHASGERSWKSAGWHCEQK